MSTAPIHVVPPVVAAEAQADPVAGRVREGESCDILAFDTDLRLVPGACRLVFPRGSQTLP